MVTTKTYNGIEFIDLGMARLFAREKFASKDDAETALERALCEYVKDEPMNYRWSLSADLESREEVDLESDEDIKADFAPIWAERFESAVRMYPDEFTEEEKKQAQRLVLALTHE